MKALLKTILFFLLFVPTAVFSPNEAQAQNDNMQAAKDLAEGGQFERALPFFEELVHLYPADKELNYYLGMCLAETGRFSEKTKTTLQTSLGDGTPSKSLYYLAQCFHAENDFTQALSYYQQFSNKAKKKVKGATRLDELTALARRQINPFKQADTVTATAETQETTQPDAQTASPAVSEKPEEVEIPQEWKDSLINFQVNSFIKYLKFEHFKSAQSLRAFIHALKTEREVQELSEEANQLRENYNSAFASEKEEIANKILELEKDIYIKNKEIARDYNEVRAHEIDFWSKADASEAKTFSDQIRFLEDSISEAKRIARLEKLEAEKPIILPDSLFSTPELTETTPPDHGVVYKIQIGAYRNAPPDWAQRLFKKLSVIRRIDQYKDEKGVTVYTVGELKSYDAALQMLAQVKAEGVSDAVIAAYLNGKRITVNEARKISEP